MKLGYDLSKCVLIHNIPPELEESEIRSFCDPFGGVRKVYMLRDSGERFLGDAVAEWWIVAGAT